MTELTERQAELHRFLCDHWNDQPSYRDMAAHMGVTLTAIIGHLKALERKGYIEKPDAVRSRGLKLLIGPDLNGSYIEIAGRTYQLVSSKETAF